MAVPADDRLGRSRFACGPGPARVGLSVTAPIDRLNAAAACHRWYGGCSQKETQPVTVHGAGGVPRANERVRPIFGLEVCRAASVHRPKNEPDPTPRPRLPEPEPCPAPPGSKQP